MDSCMTCKIKNKCLTFKKDGSIIGCINWEPVENLK